jgi:hypothetical protein
MPRVSNTKTFSWRQFYAASRVPSCHAAINRAEKAGDFPLNWRIIKKMMRELPDFERVRVTVVHA